MSDADTLDTISVVLGRITDLMDNHPSDYKMAKESIAQARSKLVDSPKKALKLCDKAYRYALGESLLVIRYGEIIGDTNISGIREKDESVDKMFTRYKENIDVGEYDKALEILENIGKAIKGSIPPQFLTVAVMNYTVPESEPIVELSISNVSEKSIIVNTATVSPSYCKVVSNPNKALYSGDSMSIKIELDCIEGKYPMMYTLTYTVDLQRNVKKGSATINVFDDEE